MSGACVEEVAKRVRAAAEGASAFCTQLLSINPHLAAGGDSHALRAGMTALRAFRDAYRAAWKRFKQGLHAIFPGGTLLMHKRFGAECEPLDACWCQFAGG